MGVTFRSTVIAGVMLTSHTPGAGRTLGFVTLATWLLDAASGGYMLRTWIARGGLRRQRSTDSLAPVVVFSHFGLASTGLLLWISYLATRWITLAWLAVGGLVLVIGLGISTVTVWTPYPAHEAGPPAGHLATGTFAGPDAENISRRVTDEMLTRALTDEVLLGKLVDDVIANVPAHPARRARKPQAHLTTLIPAGHGIAALATMILAVLTAASAR